MHAPMQLLEAVHVHEFGIDDCRRAIKMELRKRMHDPIAKT
jgi:hypothetical protein